MISLILLGTVVGAAAGCIMPLIPNTSVVNVLAVGVLVPTYGGIAAICSGYYTYQACSTYRDAFRPNSSGDHYTQSVTNPLELILPTEYQFALIRNAKELGVLVGLILSLGFFLCSFYQIVSVGFSYVILGAVITFSGIATKRPDHLLVFAAYLLTVSLLFKLSGSVAPSPVLALGTSFFSIPSLLFKTRMPELKVPHTASKLDCPMETALSTPIGIYSPLACAIAPGVSSSAISNWVFNKDEQKNSVYTSELAVETYGLVFSMLSTNYGSSLLNIEINTYDLELGWLSLLLGGIAIAAFALAWPIAKSNLYQAIAEHIESMNLTMFLIGMNIFVLVLSAGFYAPVFLAAGILIHKLMLETETPPTVKSFTFLGAMLPI